MGIKVWFPNMFMRLINVKMQRTPPTATFHVPPAMTKTEIKQYLEKVIHLILLHFYLNISFLSYPYLTTAIFLVIRSDIYLISLIYFLFTSFILSYTLSFIYLHLLTLTY